MKITTAPGVVKPSRGTPEDLQDKVISAAGESLWKGTVTEPAAAKLENDWVRKTMESVVLRPNQSPLP